MEQVNLNICEINFHPCPKQNYLFNIMSFVTSTAHYLAKPATCGAVAYAATTAWYPHTATIDLFGVTMPVQAALALGTVVGSLAAEFVHCNVFPQMAMTGRYSQMEAAAISVAANAGVNAALLIVNGKGSLESFGLVSVIALSLFSEMAGDYIYTHFVSPVVLSEDMPGVC